MPDVTDPLEMAGRVPPGFVIGVSTSAYQIEGASDLRGRAGWDDFAATPGHILDGSNALVAADHYHRAPHDVALLRDLGVDAYRFSLSWPRIQPGGSGPADRDGLAFYDRLLDDLLEAGIRPMVTLFHWDTPAELERAGGWVRRETALRFAEYARIAGEAFGDRVEWWVTINEPATVSLEGYALDVHSPGRASISSAARSAEHLLLGHGLAVQALREVPVRGAIGISNVHTPVFAASTRWRDRKAAEIFSLLNTRVFADPVLLGRAPRGGGLVGFALRAFAGTHPKDLRIMSTPIDFYGVHYYFPSRVAAGRPRLRRGTHDGHSRAMLSMPLRLEPWPEYPVTGFGWANAPELLGTLLGRLRESYGDALPPLMFTESGASYPDVVGPDGAIHDPERTEYLARHLAAAVESAPGVDVRGWFVWSFLDNFEWAAGYTQRFGLVHVDPQTLERRPKSSFRWLREVQRARKH